MTVCYLMSFTQTLQVLSLEVDLFKFALTSHAGLCGCELFGRHKLPFSGAWLDDMEISREREERSASKLATMLASIPTLPRKRLGYNAMKIRWSNAPKPSAIALDSLSPNRIASKSQPSPVNTTASKYNGVIRGPVDHHTEIETPSSLPDESLHNTCFESGPSTIDIGDDSRENTVVDTGQKRPDSDIKQLSIDCYVDLACHLPEEFQRTWDSHLHRRLRNILIHEMDESNFSLECHMVCPQRGLIPEPTVIVMVISPGSRSKIEDTFRRRLCIPQGLRLKVLVLDVQLCSGKTSRSQQIERELARMMVTAMVCTSNQRPELIDIFGNLSKIHNGNKQLCSTKISTIGGVISINDVYYGLTVGHAISIASRDEQNSRKTSGVQRRACST